MQSVKEQLAGNLSTVWREQCQTTAGLWVDIADDKLFIVGRCDGPRRPHAELSTPRGQNLPTVDRHHLDAAAPLVTVDHHQIIRSARAHVVRIDVCDQVAAMSAVRRVELDDLPGRQVGYRQPIGLLSVPGRRTHPEGVKEDRRDAREGGFDLVGSQHGRFDEVGHCHRPKLLLCAFRLFGRRMQFAVQRCALIHVRHRPNLRPVSLETSFDPRQ